MATDPEVLASYFSDALNILKRSVELAQNEQPAFYRVAAVQLRLLCCDTTRRHGDIVDISLLARLLPGLRLAPLAGAHFNHSLPALPLAAWLEQPLPLEPALTIRRLIRRVCEQDGGAHVDPRPVVSLPTGDVRAWVLAIAGEVLHAVAAARACL